MANSQAASTGSRGKAWPEGNQNQNQTPKETRERDKLPAKVLTVGGGSHPGKPAPGGGGGGSSARSRRRRCHLPHLLQEIQSPLQVARSETGGEIKLLLPSGEVLQLFLEGEQ